MQLSAQAGSRLDTGDAMPDLPPFKPYPDAILGQLSICRGLLRVGRCVVVNSRPSDVEVSVVKCSGT